MRCRSRGEWVVKSYAAFTQSASVLKQLVLKSTYKGEVYKTCKEMSTHGCSMHPIYILCKKKNLLTVSARRSAITDFWCSNIPPMQDVDFIFRWALSLGGMVQFVFIGKYHSLATRYSIAC